MIKQIELPLRGSPILLITRMTTDRIGLQSVLLLPLLIIRVINKIGRLRSGSPICFITSMITNRIGRQEVLLPIYHNFNRICDIELKRLFFKIKTEEIQFFLLVMKKLSARVMARTVLKAEIRAVDSHSDLRILS